MISDNSIINNNLPGPIALIKEAWEIFKVRFWIFAGIFLSTILLYAAVFSVVGSLGVVAFFAFGGNFDSVPFIISGGVLILILALVMMYLSGLLQAAWFIGASGNDVINFREVIRKSKIFVWPVLITSSISGLITLGGIFLLVIPGIVFSIWFSFIVFVIVNENKKYLLALHTSREYIRGRFWKVVWRWLVVYAPFLLVGLIPGFSERENEWVNGIIQLFSFLSAPFYLVYGYVMYRHLKDISVAPVIVPSKNKLLYFGVPVVGFIIFLVTAIVVTPYAARFAQEMINRQNLNQQNQVGNPEAIQTEVYSGVFQYFADNREFPNSLDDLVTEGYIDSIPKVDSSGFNYVYTPSSDNQGFTLCMVTKNGSESCATYPIVTQAPI